MIFELAPPKYYTTPSCYTISDCYRHTSETPNTVRPHGRIQRGKAGGPDLPPPPPRNHKAIGCLSNTGPDPLKNHKATKPALTVRSSSACQRNSIPFKWLFAFWPALSGNWILSTPPPPPSTEKRRCQSWTPSDKTFWIRAWAESDPLLYAVSQCPSLVKIGRLILRHHCYSTCSMVLV